MNSWIRAISFSLIATLLVTSGIFLYAEETSQLALYNGSDLAVGFDAATFRPECEALIVYDDGTPESGLGFGSSATIWYGQLFDVPHYPVKIDKVCVGWTRNGFDKSITFYVEIYDSAGAGGAPSTLIGSHGPFSTTTPVPAYPEFAWYSVPLNVTLNDNAYIVIQWDSGNDQQFSLSMDASGTGVRTPGYYRYSTSPAWKDVTVIAPNFEAFYIRAGSVAHFPS